MGAKQENGTWRKRYNYEPYEIFNEPNIVNYIIVKRLAWAGQLVPMNNDRTIKKIFNTKPDGARSAGRPKLRWEYGVSGVPKGGFGVFNPHPSPEIPKF